MTTPETGSFQLSSTTVLNGARMVFKNNFDPRSGTVKNSGNVKTLNIYFFIFFIRLYVSFFYFYTCLYDCKRIMIYCQT